MSNLVGTVSEFAYQPLEMSKKAKANLGNDWLGSLAERLLILVGVITILVSVPFQLLAGIYDMIANAMCGPEGSVWHSFKETLEGIYASIFAIPVPAFIFAVSPHCECIGKFNKGWIETAQAIYPDCMKT